MGRACPVATWVLAALPPPTVIWSHMWVGSGLVHWLWEEVMGVSQW